MSSSSSNRGAVSLSVGAEREKGLELAGKPCGQRIRRCWRAARSFGTRRLRDAEMPEFVPASPVSCGRCIREQERAIVRDRRDLSKNPIRLISSSAVARGDLHDGGSGVDHNPRSLTGNASNTIVGRCRAGNHQQARRAADAIIGVTRGVAADDRRQAIVCGEQDAVAHLAWRRSHCRSSDGLARQLGIEIPEGVTFSVGIEVELVGPVFPKETANETDAVDRYRRMTKKGRPRPAVRVGRDVGPCPHRDVARTDVLGADEEAGASIFLRANVDQLPLQRAAAGGVGEHNAVIEAFLDP